LPLSIECQDPKGLYQTLGVDANADETAIRLGE